MRKNILLFGHGYATQFIDISNQYTNLFDKEKYEVTVAYLVGEPNEEIRNKHLADHVIFINSPKSSTRGLKLYAIKKMLALQREKNFQIVVCHRYKPTYIMLWVSQLQRIPVLFSVMHELGTLGSISRKLIIAMLAKKNTVFAGVSNAVRDNLRKTIWNVPHERVITLYNMIDVDLTEPQLLSREAAREELQLPQDAFIFGTLGRLAINKDQKTLIEAFAKIKSQCPNAKLVIIGEGQLEAELKQQAAQLHLTDDIIFTGFVRDGFRFTKAFDVYISSSIQEAFGRVLLEAMIAKVPIIATSVNGVPEVVGDAGILINAADATQLADKMLNLYNASPTDREVQGMSGYQRATRDFSLKKFNEIFWNLDIIKKVFS
jgi:glycosyltransferase involved in cell wall biosynthesis